MAFVLQQLPGLSRCPPRSMWQHGLVRHIWQPQEDHFQLVVSVNGLRLLTERCSGGSSEWLWWPKLHARPAGGMGVIGPPEALFPIFSFPWGPQFGQAAGEGGAGFPAHFQVQGLPK